MLEDPKTQELKKRRDSEGEDCLTYDELKYLIKHVSLPYEQETIKNILIIRNHEERVNKQKTSLNVPGGLLLQHGL